MAAAHNRINTVKTRPLRNHPDKPLYDVTFALRFSRGKQMTACEQIRVRDVMVTVAYI